MLFWSHFLLGVSFALVLLPHWERARGTEGPNSMAWVLPCVLPSCCLHLRPMEWTVQVLMSGEHILNGVIKDTLIEHAPILPRILLCNHNKYIFNDRSGIYILEMALGNRSRMHF